MTIVNGILSSATQIKSINFDPRPIADDISLLVIHNISLPPNEFGSNDVEDFFTGRLKVEKHPFFKQIIKLKVSAHLLIKREGSVIQFVDFSQRAWHAGESCFNGRPCCNDFSIGIELEGTDNIDYTGQQYQQLTLVTQQIVKSYPKITLDRICGHSDIAPKRKTDPGLSFDWLRYRQSL